MGFINFSSLDEDNRIERNGLFLQE